MDTVGHKEQVEQQNIYMALHMAVANGARVEQTESLYSQQTEPLGLPILLEALDC
jgi:hypothetical protein